jgi:hypothetical protein
MRARARSGAVAASKPAKPSRAPGLSSSPPGNIGARLPRARFACVSAGLRPRHGFLPRPLARVRLSRSAPGLDWIIVLGLSCGLRLTNQPGSFACPARAVNVARDAQTGSRLPRSASAGVCLVRVPVVLSGRRGPRRVAPVVARAAHPSVLPWLPSDHACRRPDCCVHPRLRLRRRHLPAITGASPGARMSAAAALAARHPCLGFGLLP